MKARKTVLGQLRAARALIEKAPKLGKGAGAKDTPAGVCYCALGALAVAQGQEPGYWEEAECTEAGRALSYALPPPYKDGSVFEYNDAPRTTKAKIINLFDRAIKLATKAGAK